MCYCPRGASAQLRACAGLSAAAFLLVRGAELREGSPLSTVSEASAGTGADVSKASATSGSGSAIVTSVTSGFSVAEAARAVHPFCAFFLEQARMLFDMYLFAFIL